MDGAGVGDAAEAKDVGGEVEAFLLRRTKKVAAVEAGTKDI